MSRRRKARKKGMSPVLAVLMLIGSVTYVGSTVWNPFGAGDSQDLASLVGFEADDPMLDDPQGGGEQIVWRDLLAEHGSYDRERDGAVRASFSSLLDLTVAFAAPGAEIGMTVGDRWRGEDPPMARLGVIMVSEGSRRAVFDGEVVGIGDSVVSGTVVAIEPGRLQLRWNERLLTYDLDGTAPREFRTELLRRKLEEGKQREDQEPAGGAGSAAKPAREEGR